jgi:hypothetical protein
VGLGHHINYWGNIAAYRAADDAQRQGLEQLYAQGRALDALEAADTYGGPTPQATWDLFVKALEAGDTDLASKYFVVEKQAEMKKFFDHGKELKKLYVLLDDFKTIQEGRQLSTENFEFITKKEPVTTESGKVIDMPGVYELILNKKANIWKIYHL